MLMRTHENVSSRARTRTCTDCFVICYLFFHCYIIINIYVRLYMAKSVQWSSELVIDKEEKYVFM